MIDQTPYTETEQEIIVLRVRPSAQQINRVRNNRQGKIVRYLIVRAQGDDTVVEALLKLKASVIGNAATATGLVD